MLVMIGCRRVTPETADVLVRLELKTRGKALLEKEPFLVVAHIKNQTDRDIYMEMFDPAVFEVYRKVRWYWLPAEKGLVPPSYLVWGEDEKRYGCTPRYDFGGKAQYPDTMEAYIQSYPYRKGDPYGRQILREAVRDVYDNRLYLKKGEEVETCAVIDATTLDPGKHLIRMGMDEDVKLRAERRDKETAREYGVVFPEVDQGYERRHTLYVTPLEFTIRRL